MGNLGFTEIMVILLVVLLLFGAKRLPEVGSSIGKGIREFKRSLSDTQDAIMGSDESRNLQSRPPEPPAQNQASSGEPKRLSQYPAGPRNTASPHRSAGSRRLRPVAWRQSWLVGDCCPCCCGCCERCCSLPRLSTTLAAWRSAAR